MKRTFAALSFALLFLGLGAASLRHHHSASIVPVPLCDPETDPSCTLGGGH